MKAGTQKAAGKIGISGQISFQAQGMGRELTLLVSLLDGKQTAATLGGR